MSRKIIYIFIIFSFFIPSYSKAYTLSKVNESVSRHSFYYWQCTWYVAKYKYVNWGGNANQWITNAKEKWRVISQTPRVWAIVQFSWPWYNRQYWHVAIVRAIKDNYIIISEMNYRKLWEITYRYININDININWYIL